MGNGDGGWDSSVSGETMTERQIDQHAIDALATKIMGWTFNPRQATPAPPSLGGVVISTGWEDQDGKPAWGSGWNPIKNPEHVFSLLEKLEGSVYIKRTSREKYPWECVIRYGEPENESGIGGMGENLSAAVVFAALAYLELHGEFNFEEQK